MEQPTAAASAATTVATAAAMTPALDAHIPSDTTPRQVPAEQGALIFLLAGDKELYEDAGVQADLAAMGKVQHTPSPFSATNFCCTTGALSRTPSHLSDTPTHARPHLWRTLAGRPRTCSGRWARAHE